MELPCCLGKIAQHLYPSTDFQNSQFSCLYAKILNQPHLTVVI